MKGEVHMCKCCDQPGKESVEINDSAAYSGIQIEINKQGMLRVRYYGSRSILFESQDIVNVPFCPIYGKKFKRKG